MLDKVHQKRRRKEDLSFYPTPFSDNTQLYIHGIRSSVDEALSRMEVLLPDDNDGECVSEPWQRAYHPSCNGMHEFDDDDNGGPVELFENKEQKHCQRIEDDKQNKRRCKTLHSNVPSSQWDHFGQVLLREAEHALRQLTASRAFFCRSSSVVQGR